MMQDVKYEPKEVQRKIMMAIGRAVEEGYEVAVVAWKGDKAFADYFHEKPSVEELADRNYDWFEVIKVDPKNRRVKERVRYLNNNEHWIAISGRYYWNKDVAEVSE